MFGTKAGTAATTVPGEEQPPVEVQPNEPVTAAVVPVETAPVAELPTVQLTTPYTIQRGDTISSVSYKYNLRWQDVLAVNPGVNPTKLRVGQVIQLPGQVNLSSARHVPAASSKKASAPKISAPKASAEVSGPMTTYVVKAGDSLSVIAYKHGVKTAALRAANGLKSDRIVVGQKLKVPGAKKVVADKKSAPVKVKSAPPKTTPPKVTESASAKPEAAEATPAPAAPSAPVESAPVKVETAAPPPPAPAAPAADANVQTYTVKEGEDLYAVAIRWGVSPSDLKSLNNLTSTDLKAGTVLKIPGAAQ